MHDGRHTPIVGFSVMVVIEAMGAIEERLGVRVGRLEADAAGLLAELDVEVLSGGDARVLAERLAVVGRLVSAAVTLCAGRAQAANGWRASGHRSAVEWLAHTTGTGTASAERTLQTASRLREQPEITELTKAGRLSPAQTECLAAAAEADPGAAAGLVDRAGGSVSFRELRQACQSVRFAAAGADGQLERARRAHERRYLHTWVDPDGAGRVDALMAVEDLARFEACLAPFELRAFETARQTGHRDRHDAYRVDGVLAMADAATTAKDEGVGVAASVVVLVDHAALTRGWVEPGECCQIEGVGPVPVAAVEAMLADAFLAAVVTDGVDVRSVVHLGRSVTALQRTALMVRDRTCVVPGCAVSYGLEIDHVEPWAGTRRTTLEHLARLCRFHHRQKTYDGAVLAGSPGHWTWTPPPPAVEEGFYRTGPP